MHWHHVIKFSGVYIAEGALRYRSAAELCVASRPRIVLTKRSPRTSQRWSHLIRGVTVPNSFASPKSRLAGLIDALSGLPDLQYLSLPIADLGSSWPRLPALRHLVVRLLDVASARHLPSLLDKLPALRSMDVSAAYQPHEDPLVLIPFLAHVPVTRLAIYTASPGELSQLNALASLTEIDLTWGSNPRDTPDFTSLPFLRSVTVMSFTDVPIDITRVAVPGLTSLTLRGRSIITLPSEAYRLPATLEHLHTGDWDLVMRAPTSLRSLACQAAERDLHHLARFVALSTLLLPLILQESAVAVLASMTRLEDLGAKTLRGDLSTLPRLRTLRLEHDMQALPMPSPHIRALHINSPHYVEASGLRAVARKWAHVRELSIKGMWGFITSAEWGEFASSMPQLMTFRMLYTIRRPSDMTVSGAIEAFAGKRLVIEE